MPAVFKFPCTVDDEAQTKLPAEPRTVHDVAKFVIAFRRVGNETAGNELVIQLPKRQVVALRGVLPANRIRACDDFLRIAPRVPLLVLNAGHHAPRCSYDTKN